ncbi:hypothetical protein DFH09DRAFT_1182753 [Mycena vulgaris]|nr:hypothetical protein DFH09DRAFT_1182753 [Mycena vulgaris]
MFEIVILHATLASSKTDSRSVWIPIVLTSGTIHLQPSPHPTTPPWIGFVSIQMGGYKYEREGKSCLHGVFQRDVCSIRRGDNGAMVIAVGPLFPGQYRPGLAPENKWDRWDSGKPFSTASTWPATIPGRLTLPFLIANIMFSFSARVTTFRPPYPLNPD